MMLSLDSWNEKRASIGLGVLVCRPERLLPAFYVAKKAKTEAAPESAAPASTTERAAAETRAVPQVRSHFHSLVVLSSPKKNALNTRQNPTNAGGGFVGSVTANRG